MLVALSCFYYLVFLHRANAFAERLQLNIAVLHGEHNQEDSEICDGRQSPPPARRSRNRGFSECTSNNEMMVSLGRVSNTKFY